MSTLTTYYALTAVEGLHLKCDYVMHSASLYGTPPEYVKTMGNNDPYAEPYHVLSGVPFKQYSRLGEAATMDAGTTDALNSLPDRRLADFTCMAFEVELDASTYVLPSSAADEASLLAELLERGERILDVLRLFLFRPGDDASIGRLGAVGAGVRCIWLGRDDGAMKFVARPMSRYQLVQPALEIGLEEIRRIHEHRTLRELRSAACSMQLNDPYLERIFVALRALRITRDLENVEARFRGLAAISEQLAKRTAAEHLNGNELRTRIARLAFRGQEDAGLIFGARDGWASEPETRTIVADLWTNVRNPLSHSLEDVWQSDLLRASTHRRDPIADLRQLESIVTYMLHALVHAWVFSEFVDSGDPYELLLP